MPLPDAYVGPVAIDSLIVKGLASIMEYESAFTQYSRSAVINIPHTRNASQAALMSELTPLVVGTVRSSTLVRRGLPSSEILPS